MFISINKKNNDKKNKSPTYLKCFNSLFICNMYINYKIKPILLK